MKKLLIMAKLWKQEVHDWTDDFGQNQFGLVLVELWWWELKCLGIVSILICVLLELW